MVRTQLTVLTFIVSSAFSSSFAKTWDLLEFLKENAAEVEQAELEENLRYFIDVSFKNQKLAWHIGYFIETKGKKYENLALKFNTYSNSLYINYRGKIYVLLATDVQEFGFANERNSRRFMRGFGKLKRYQITATFYLNSKESLQFLSEYPELSTFTFRELRFNQLSLEECQVDMELFSSQRSRVLSFMKAIREHPEIKDAQLDSETSPVNEKTFFEVLVSHKDFYFLKYNSKRISSHDSNSLAKHSGTISFDDSSYFLANSAFQIQQIRFTRKSISEAFEITKIPLADKIPSIRNEKQCTRWLQQL